jgi:pyridoxamine 5'-phosphate oxidase
MGAQCNGTMKIESDPISAMRRDYALASLSERDVDADPIRQFERWFADAVSARVPEPNAMTLATASRDGVPAARIVLLKGVDAAGFVFYTDYRSRKAAELTENPLAALTFLWKEIERQVRITGSVARVSTAESEAYFRTRPPGSRLGAWASRQSSVLASRDELEERLREVAARFPDGDVPLPPHWGGFRVVPDEVEFWQGRPDRLHDRLLYRREEAKWAIVRLSP